ncbi:hypothetical protein ASE92_07840 [Pedobacter sp. Leaf41]|nr:hypothetical protein ASE92_07840 [Pedobacter sp. Leaf41]
MINAEVFEIILTPNHLQVIKWKIVKGLNNLFNTYNRNGSAIHIHYILEVKLAATQTNAALFSLPLGAENYKAIYDHLSFTKQRA